MNNSEYNKAENAVNNVENSLKNAADKAKWKINELADRAKIILMKRGIMMKKQT
jgi:hypothetical protein